MGARFPFASYPRGWFVVAFSGDVAAGAVKTVHYFGQDIVLFRTAVGRLSALDRTCPHLGAHLGAGWVDGECLRCPFHLWAFDGNGRCVEVPYSNRIPAKASVSSWPVRELNGVVLVWHCPRGEVPTWEPPALPEEGWTANRTDRWEIHSHPQEVAERAVDSAHRRPTHHAISVDAPAIVMDGHHMRVTWPQAGGGVDGVETVGVANAVEADAVDAVLDVTLDGLGMIVSTTHVLTTNLRARRRIYPTPIDEERIAIFGVHNTETTPDAQFTREVDELFYQAYVAEFPRDFPIWETKAYLDQPMLVGGDRPIAEYRAWTRQFYDTKPEVTATPNEATARANEQRGALVRLGEWLRKVARPGEAAVTGEAVDGENAGDTGDAVDHGNHGNHESMVGDEADEGDEAVHTSAVQAPVVRTVRFPSVDEYFATLTARFDPRVAGDLEAVFQWVLTGEPGDPPRVHFAIIKNGDIELVDGTHARPTVTIEMAAADYLLMINGELNGARAFSTGRGKLRGPVRLAMKMQRLFPLDRVVH